MTITTPEPTRHDFHSMHLRLSYVDWGNADAPLLLLIHGGRDHARSWDFVARALCRDWHVIAPDWRGHGDSDWSHDTAYLQIFFMADLAALIEHVSGGKPVTIVAHSMGASLSLRYAGLFPEKVRHLAAIEGIGLSGPQDFEKVSGDWRIFLERAPSLSAHVPRKMASLAEAGKRMQAVNPHLSDALAQHLTLHGTRQNPDGSYSWKHDPDFSARWYPADISDEHRRQLWSQIACPVWLVHGADSWAKHPDAENRSSAFVNARVTSFAGAGHWVQHDRFDGFMAELNEFLAS